MDCLETCLLTGEGDRVLCHRMMFLEMRRLLNSSEIQFLMASFSKKSLLYFTMLDV